MKKSMYLIPLLTFGILISCAKDEKYTVTKNSNLTFKTVENIFNADRNKLKFLEGITSNELYVFDVIKGNKKICNITYRIFKKITLDYNGFLFIELNNSNLIVKVDNVNDDETDGTVCSEIVKLNKKDYLFNNTSIYLNFSKTITDILTKKPFVRIGLNKFNDSIIEFIINNKKQNSKSIMYIDLSKNSYLNVVFKVVPFFSNNISTSVLNKKINNRATRIYNHVKNKKTVSFNVTKYIQSYDKERVTDDELSYAKEKIETYNNK